MTTQTTVDKVDPPIYTADLEGWPIVIHDPQRRIVASISCLESAGLPHLPATEAAHYAQHIVNFLNRGFA